MIFSERANGDLTTVTFSGVDKTIIYTRAIVTLCERVKKTDKGRFADFGISKADTTKIFGAKTGEVNGNEIFHLRHSIARRIKPKRAEITEINVPRND